MKHGARILAGLAIVLSMATVAGTSLTGEARGLVGSESSLRYRVQQNDPGFGLAWSQPGFDDTAWATGVLPIGIETGTPVGARALIRTRVDGTAASIYCRSRFTIDDPATVTGLHLGVDYDDGFVAWINGVEVARSHGMPEGPPAWNAAPASHESSNGAIPRFHPRQDISKIGIPALRAGDNVLAVGVWNNEPDSSDLVLAVELVANQPLKTFVMRGPYLQLATETGVTVRWRTDRPTDSRVRYGTSPDALDDSVSDPRETKDHRLRLTGLQPGSTLYYAVGTSTTDLAGGDEEHFFRTAPPRGDRRPLRFWVVGDTGTGGGIPGWVREGFERHDASGSTDLWLSVGDLAYGGANDARFQYALFDVYPSVLRRAALWPSPGNHDHADTPEGTYYDVFDQPTRGEAGGVASGAANYYSFDWGNVHFVSLDTETVELTSKAPMLAWLQRDLRAAVSDWIVAFFHRAPYSTGFHDSDDDARTVRVRRHLLPILDAHGVDLVLTGHTHCCQRSALLHGHYGPSDSLAPSMIVDDGLGRPKQDGPYLKSTPRRPADGIVYAVVGCSGESTETDFSHPTTVASMDVPGSLVVDVEGLRLEAKYLDRKGRVRDHFAIVKKRRSDSAP